MSRRADAAVATLCAAASTEIVARLGMAHCLVGISHECDYPQSVMQVRLLLSDCNSPSEISHDRALSVVPSSRYWHVVLTRLRNIAAVAVL